MGLLTKWRTNRAAKVEQAERAPAAEADRLQALFPNRPAIQATILNRMPQGQHPAIIETLDDLGTHNALHRSTARPDGLARRRAQWDRVRGGRSVGTSWVWLAPLALFGAVAGWVGVAAAKGDFPTVAPYPVEVVGAVVSAVFFALIGRTFTRSAGFEYGMMQVIANERESVIQPEKVTGQARAWVPKALLAWRMADWDRQDGKPYLWLHLPLGQRIEDTLRTTLDYVALPVDEFFAHDAAVYTQRTVNRSVSDSALDHASADEGGEKDKGGFPEWVPYAGAGLLVILGVLVVILRTG